MKAILSGVVVLTALFSLTAAGVDKVQDGSPPLGLPPVPYPAANPQTPEKVALGEKLFNDKRFSSTGEVNCAQCHKVEAAFTDSPLKTSEGINKLTGTRNAPTVINSAYFKTAFWDGRSPSLEDQALHPFVNPVEMGLKDHQPILDIVRSDPDYVKAFQAVFGKQGEAVTMTEVTQAIAAFERTIVSGNSPFDRWYFGKEEDALNAQQKRGFDLFINQGRCVSCHLIEQTQALFTDNRFHNIGVGINNIQSEVPALAAEFVKAQATLAEVDVKVLSDKRTSELGRLAVTKSMEDIGSFKTSTLRNIAVTAPYMHDGSVKTLRDAVVHYNNGGVTKKGDPVNDFLSSGIRPLNLDDAQVDDLVAFLESLTSPEFAPLAKAAADSTKEKQP
ncbi:MAG TPA: cytochrome c peroxidase [Candidatus Bathyarchaeia archaeon]|nr:cytochrome c peroxidase [Candidatus Bathyarchaeia archaeon]